MGLRFRKSVKICKGMKVNFSKSGASLSLGGPGHSLNFGGRGTKATVGMPGTGLSYSSYLTSHGNSRGKSAYRSSINNQSEGAVPGNVQIKMSSDGKVEIQDLMGQTITDQSILRRIKQTDAYKLQIQNLEQQRQHMLENGYNEAKAENNKFVEIYKLSPKVDKIENYQEILNNLRPPVYVRKEYDIPQPTEESVKELLKLEAKEKVKGNIFSVGKLRKTYIEDNFNIRLNEAISQWTFDKAEFDKKELENESSETERYNKVFLSEKRYMLDLIDGNDEVVSDAIESWISSCKLPVEIKVDYEWKRDKSEIYLDVDLPEIEDLPKNEVVRLVNGNLKEKKKTQATLKQEYVNLVFGLAIFISANIYNVSPAIRSIVISGYTQRRNRAGIMNDEYVYSIKFTRDFFENSILSNVDPVSFCMRFENRCNISSTMLLKKIEPYDVS